MGNKKRFHKSDSTIYQFNSIEYPFQDIKNAVFTRDLVLVHASPNITWQDISQEIHSLRKETLVGTLHGPGSQILSTCVVDYPDFVVGLTLQGTMNIIKVLIDKNIEHLKIPYEYAYFVTVDNFAKEMIANRDYQEYEKECKNQNVIPTKNNGDFLPK